jgi:hypothetical protein
MPLYLHVPYLGLVNATASVPAPCRRLYNSSCPVTSDLSIFRLALLGSPWRLPIDDVTQQIQVQVRENGRLELK